MDHSPTLSLADRLERPISAITAYDYPMARLCDEAGIQMILVGDSLGMVVAGHPDTTSVTLEQIIYHTEMVSRGAKHAVIVADLPIHTYDDPEMALQSSRQLIAAGADAVKLEGGLGQIEKVKKLRASGIEVCGHLGMLPQRVKEEGGYKKKGKTGAEVDGMVEAAKALEEAGVFAIVLESMLPSAAEAITAAVQVPTIGIGAGGQCDGEIRVLHDVIGSSPWFVPPFATVHGNVAEVTVDALAKYLEEIQSTR
ncbi:MAG: 3-methyl-2-oxobutanoate hydroxymethyltransferase [Verrucomicrobiales bacterium]|nr:3-methyl-2-oxobutanoate hydroxymethyltransferase [Verrucomicrobiales bacterium]